MVMKLRVQDNMKGGQKIILLYNQYLPPPTPRPGGKHLLPLLVPDPLIPFLGIHPLASVLL